MFNNLYKLKATTTAFAHREKGKIVWAVYMRAAKWIYKHLYAHGYILNELY